MTADAPHIPARRDPSARPGPVVDAVVIGRNEGGRLAACLASLKGQVRRLVYVDSGSTDGSQALARGAGAIVVGLDLSRPFTAARARNAGVLALVVEGAEPDYVQFVDGDCEVVPGWVARGLQGFRDHPGAVVICGRRRERHPETSVYNRLCDREWNTPVGEALACGGDALMRLRDFQSVRGFREDLIAGEEPELCQRLRRAGGHIWRIEAGMTLHDAAMTQVSQWWRRTKRAGYAFAEGAALHGRGPDRHWRRETARALFWGAILPLVVGLAGLIHPAFWLMALIWPLQMLRLAWAWRREGRLGAEAAIFTVLGKFPEALGVIGYLRDLARGRKRGLIEYK
ncbi:glycosyltransferase family 2 protein [Paracoccus sp. IB05]|uniref:glycosyltransferase n=1 Tax=Paracoccus sp. IB05 TaxID=2779367 RepID=UPI0018E7579D|nr:glycosyltransferase [Paracoccus sp. IB05]MBJ2152325.1 glycosyltransferase [Paracoccus sp. IB05]